MNKDEKRWGQEVGDQGDYDKMDDDNERYVDGKKRLLMHYNEDSGETCR